jgi:hypothetical protein
MDAERYHVHPIVRFVRSLPGEYYLRREVAVSLQCSTTALQVLAKKPELMLGPSAHVQYGELDLLLYTPDDIERIRRFREELHAQSPHRVRGRPRMWTPEEAGERTRKQDRARYRLRQARAYREVGSPELEAAALAKAEALMAELATEYEQRRRELIRSGQLSDESHGNGDD